jgi:hypothetical protein
MRDAFNPPSSDLPVRSGDVDNLRFRGLTSIPVEFPLIDNGAASSSEWINSSYSVFRASGASLFASYFSSFCTNWLVFSDCEIVERVLRSVPLLAIDCRKRRLSRGVYCVKIEGIPYSKCVFHHAAPQRRAGVEG